ncbi:hypothetical protein V6N11_007846 [Hibiscus sabdariffa]|uniref:Uncharacterized protein n=1 Tax=Hibiscus sabdariffa TaxID=183260 RepID=A0ABR2PZB7_9ROSI
MVEECCQTAVVEKVNRYEQTASEHWQMTREDEYLDLPDLLADVTYCLLNYGLFMVMAAKGRRLSTGSVSFPSAPTDIGTQVAIEMMEITFDPGMMRIYAECESSSR